MSVADVSLAEMPSRTESSGRRWSERAQGAVLVALLAVGAWQGVNALVTPAAQKRLAPVLNTSALLDGRTAAAINFVEAHYLPADHLLRAVGGVIRWRFFGSGGPQVAVGCGDWLYLTEEAQVFRDAADNMRARAQITSTMKDAFAKRGIELLVAIVPDKARIEAATRCGAPRSAAFTGRYDDFEHQLNALGVATVDLDAAFRKAHADGPLYYRTDTHWNQRGAALAAQDIAAAVKTKMSEGFAYRTERADTLTEWSGDLLRLTSLDLVPDTLFGIMKLRPAPDQQFVERTVQTKSPPESDDLLATGPGDQVVLIGSSFSVNANFAGRLQEALSAPVNNVAEAGGGFAGSAGAYVQSGAFADNPPRVVIWEMPERTLSQPLGNTDRSLRDFH